MATDAVLYRLMGEKEPDPFYFTNTGAVFGAHDDVALVNRCHGWRNNNEDRRGYPLIRAGLAQCLDEHQHIETTNDNADVVVVATETAEAST
ncbi:hypothetical protein [Saccharopolyspora shandongensis]|uniref:hypothetical protein n=1 Tax=Saccharopolyspora shandongensis TaxID=418495 RepID=UPI0033F3CF6B